MSLKTSSGNQIYNYISIRFTNREEFQDYLISDCPKGITSYELSLNGAMYCAIVQKANNNYLSYVLFSYSTQMTQYKYYNGTWSSTLL